MTIEEIRREFREALEPKYGPREAAAMAKLTVMQLKGWTLTQMMANENREASDYIINRCREIQTQLLADMPLQYALGETSFYGLTLKVGPGVLIPRPETEELVDLIVKENPQTDLSVLDLCTGSGAIAFALARNLPFSTVEAIDVSPEAVSIAKENAANLKISALIYQEDIFKFSIPDNAYDIIVSNPPYVDESEKKDMEPNVLKYEPHIALFVPDDDPLIFYRRIAGVAAEGLKKGGRLYLEINPRHSDDLKKLLGDNGFTEIETVLDVHGKKRFIKAMA